MIYNLSKIIFFTLRDTLSCSHPWNRSVNRLGHYHPSRQLNEIDPISLSIFDASSIRQSWEMEANSHLLGVLGVSFGGYSTLMEMAALGSFHAQWVVMIAHPLALACCVLCLMNGGAKWMLTRLSGWQTVGRGDIWYWWYGYRRGEGRVSRERERALRVVGVRTSRGSSRREYCIYCKWLLGSEVSERGERGGHVLFRAQIPTFIYKNIAWILLNKAFPPKVLRRCTSTNQNWLDHSACRVPLPCAIVG